MKTLQEVKNDIAIKYECISWAHLLLYSALKAEGIPDKETIINEMAIAYASQAIDRAAECATLHVRDCKDDSIVCSHMTYANHKRQGWNVEVSTDSILTVKEELR